ncbi:hypothetical protein [Shewanella acanthi]|uniref:hypothetical protein n=1 Tax=Shewanella acanthi TaxID=2864212 RepID=UPI001C65EBF3|nr:hypothetical protein [Shewanella acanthi]QYJ80174.1 hypothetical protein K0H61_07295 [Shewanella acanthi]
MKKAVLALMTASVLSGCAMTPYKKNLETQEQSKFDNAKLVVDLSNKQLGAQYNVFTSAPGTLGAAGVAGGALGGLIVGLTEAAVNESRETDAEEAIGQIRQLLADDTLQKAYEHQYQMLITTLPQLADNTVKVYQEPPVKGVKGLGLGAQDTALILTPEYSLTPDNTMLHVMLQVQLYQGADVREKPKLLYQNRFLYQSKGNAYVDNARSDDEKQAYIEQVNAKYATLSKDDRERLKQIKKRNRELAAVDKPLDEASLAAKQAKIWLAEDGKLLRQYIEEGMQEVFSMLAYDIEEQTDFTQGKVFPMPFRSFSTLAGERRWYRLAEDPFTGILLSLNGTDVFRGAKTAQGKVMVVPLRQ